MRPNDRDAACLWDMADAVRTALELTKGYDRLRYLGDRAMQLAVERLVEIIGEAARRVSTEFQHAHPEIPWRSIIAQRHVLAHEYGQIKQERMWRVVAEELPRLAEALSSLARREG